MAGVILQGPDDTSLARGGVAGQQYRSAECWPEMAVSDQVLGWYPTAGLWVPGSYASVWDVIETSIPEDQALDFQPSTLQRWLLIGAGTINEHLGNRGWPVPLTAWSITVVTANCELCYIGASRRRGINTEAVLADFRAREDKVMEWCRTARDRMITPDPRPSAADLGQQAFRYVGTRARGWDQPVGYLHGVGTGRSWRY